MNRYRIGLMVGSKSIEYVQAIRMGVQNTLEESGHILVAISDLIPFHSRMNAKEYFHVAFEVAARLNLDAVIVPAGVVAGYLTDDHESLPELLGILDSSRTLVIERRIPGYRSIDKDNAPGMHACMRHLIETCGYRKIAFLGGPPSSTGGRQREAIYYQEMADHGLEVPASFVEHGEYSGECGDSIDKLIDNNPGLEAIACCCDLEAHAVYRTLHQRRLVVGRDISVTGFDDHPMSAHLDPPLSTVSMTSYDLGCMAAREALRICEGKPQKTFTQPSRFIARGSCGEENMGMFEQFRALMVRSPLPVEDMARLLVESSLTMASKPIAQDFTNKVCAVLEQIRRSYVRHLKDPTDAQDLFSSQMLTMLFHQTYWERISLEGFHTAAIALLQALSSVAPNADTAAWVLVQISHLHLGVARMLTAELQESRASTSRQAWMAFHLTDDALRESQNPRVAYRHILEDFRALGVARAHLYLLPEPVAFVGKRTFALSDAVLPIGDMVEDTVHVPEHATPVALQQLLDIACPGNDTNVWTVGGIMAGNELVGVVALDGGTLDDDGQLISFLNLGIALKHLQMIASERESNELLSKSNLLLERQSHYDEMTGALNRRGFMGKVKSLFSTHVGALGALFYLDLDGLKTINDTFGHDIGDEAIRSTTRILDAFLPHDTVVGRLGGDEFVAFALIEDECEIEAIGRSVDAGMDTFNASHAYPFELSISYGGIPIRIEETSFANITQALVLADERQYTMKRTKKTARRS